MEPFSYFLAMTRLAPIQAVLPGHPVTTGLPTIDYFVSNAPMELPEAQDHYSETLVTLPGLPVSYAKPELPKTWLSRTELGLPDNKHLYLCAMTLFKIHPNMDIAFQQILERDPLAEICLFRFQETGQHLLLKDRFERSLGGLAERIRFLPWAPKEAFFSLLAQADLALDSHPFGGGSTHYLTLATGTPVLTWPSPWLRGRSAAGMYQILEIPELVTASAEEFAQRAVQIASTPDLRHALSERIQAGHPLLFDNLQGPREFANWLTTELLK
jgi:protein O-GlcNAc transferase